ncbi:MAG: zinc-ribbon domain-containing protein, partial [Candidatus Weimeria sp.]
MRYCKKCGAAIPDGCAFCTKCGTPVGESEPVNNNTRQDISWQQPQFQQPPFAQPAPAKKTVNKGLIIGIAAAVCAAIVIIFGIHYQRHSYKLKDYVKVDYTGYEDYGTADPTVNTDKLSSRLEKLFGLSDKDLEDYNSLSEFGGDLNKSLMIENFIDSIEPEVKSSTQGTLSNGDTVKIRIKYSKALAKKLGLFISGDTVTVKVSGLEKGKAENPFDSIEVSFTGALPYLEPQIDVDDDSDFDASEFTITTDDGESSDDGTVYLSKAGEEFTITFNGESDPEDGYIYSPTEKKYQAGKTDTFIKSPSELGTADRKQLVGHAKKFLRDNYYYEDDMKFAGIITELGKSDTSFDGWAQKTYVVFSYPYDDWDAVYTRYVYVMFPDVVKQSDGTLWYDYGDGNSNLEYSYDSYDSTDELRSYVITDGYDMKAD